MPIETTPSPATNFLDVSGIRKSFQGRTVLFDISVHIARGEIIGFVGPNGAGKSTTMKIMSGLLRPEAGTVQLDGVDLRQEPCLFLLQIGALIESPAFYPSLSAFDHVAYFARLRKTMISALVTTAFAFFALGLLTMYRSLEFGQYHFIRYYFSAMENLPFPFKPNFPMYPFNTFCLVTLVPCLIFFLPPLLYFHLHDITE